MVYCGEMLPANYRPGHGIGLRLETNVDGGIGVGGTLMCGARNLICKEIIVLSIGSGLLPGLSIESIASWYPIQSRPCS